MIFEAEPGIFYQFSKKENTWIGIDGYKALGIASQMQSGLMSKEDLKKLNGLLVPPPRISLTSEDCLFEFNSGIFGFRSSKGHLSISSDIELRNKVDDEEIVEIQPWKIHENTFGYEFKINTDKIVDEMKARDNFSMCGTLGEQGETGDEGDPGIDRLETGPVGDKGADGKNIPFQGFLSVDSISNFEQVGKKNRAIVNIETEEVSKDENYLVLTRANIGNPDACPNRVRPKNFKSPFVAAISEDFSSGLKRISNIDGSIICSKCSSIYFLDMMEIEDQVFDYFKARVYEMKLAKEELVNNWLATLISIFNQQKEALCCALENCQSRKRNQNERQYIEQQRIQAAVGGFRLNIDGSEAKNFTPMNTDETPPNGEVKSGDPNNCLECLLEIKVDGVNNAGSPSRAVVASLPAGSYIAEITDCCIEFIENRWNGIIKFQYRLGDDRKSNLKTVGEIYDDTGVITIPNLGDKRSNFEARQSYVGMTFAFVHAGGEIRAWYPDVIEHDNSGSVSICIRKTDCIELPGGTEGDITDLSNTDFAKFEMCCDMPASQISWYERGWRIGACCGAYLEIDGIKWIVVKRSLGADTSCGGGESMNTACISAAIEAGMGHPAIAYQSVDGEEFIGKKNSGVQTFAFIKDMSDAAVVKIQAGNTFETKGDAKGNISKILFPVTDAISCANRDGNSEGLVIRSGLLAEYFWDVAGTIPVPGGSGPCSFDFDTYPQSGNKTTKIDPYVNWNAENGDWPPQHPKVLYRTNAFATRWIGEIWLDANGTWDLKLGHKDGVRVYVALLAEDTGSFEQKLDDFNVGDKYIPPQPIINLGVRTAGWYPIAIEYFADLGNSAIRLEYRLSPATYFEVVPEDHLRVKLTTFPQNPNGSGYQIYAYYPMRPPWEIIQDIAHAIGRIFDAIFDFFGDLFDW